MMVLKATLLPATVCVLALSLLSAAEGRKDDQATPSSGKVKLTFNAGTTVKCFTPTWATGGSTIESRNSVTRISILGKSIAATGWVTDTGYQVGLDTNGDGAVKPREQRDIPRNEAAIITLKVGGRELAVRFVDVLIHYDPQRKEVTYMFWRMQGLYGLTGKINSVPIRILDQNMDGKYSNTGVDAICIGRSRFALPLRTYHKIGDHFYQIRIANDGSTLDYSKASNVQIGQVKIPMPKKRILGLVLENGSSAFDITKCGETGIPAGTYYLSYGALGDPKSPLAFFRRKLVKYEIQADKSNLILMGPPLQLVFSAEYREDKTVQPVTRKILVRDPRYIQGCVGEYYGPINYPNAGSEKGRPGVAILRGSRFLSKAVMPEWKGGVGNYWWEMPRRLSPRGLKVMVVAQTRELGKVTGVRTLQQIVTKEEFKPPKTDKPPVTTMPWQKGKDPKKPSTVKQPVKPRQPTTRPKSTRPKTVANKEQKAGRLVQLARSYDRMNLRSKAVEKLKEVVVKYPDTKAAATAKQLLADMK